MKALIHLKEEDLKDKTAIHWELVSASLNGYYQEIKTIWRPYMMFTDASTGGSHFAYMLDDVMGNFIYKTRLMEK